MIDLCREGQLIQIFCLELRSLRIQMNSPVLAIAGSWNLAERLALCEFHNGVVKLSGHNEIDLRAGQKAIWFELDGRADEGDLQVRFHFLDFASKRDIVVEAHSGGEKNQEVVVPRYLDRFFRSNAMRRRIQQSTAG